jgi:tRNA threonylcarbamoyl adenosine modification protein YeaZ
MRLLVLDCALGRCTAAVIDEETVAAVRTEALTRGHEARLPVMARDVMREAGAGPDLVAVTVGPGSFTGIRAALALGHGIGLALGVPVTGVTVGEAIADAFPGLTHRALWVVAPSRRGHVFLEQNGVAESLALDALPAPAGPVALAGPGAIGVAAQLAARDFNVMLTDARFPSPRHIAAVARRRHASGADRPAQPLYVDPPEAKPPAGGLRPMPLPASGV